MVGEPLGEPVTAVVTRREAQRYARAVGDLAPIYFDEDAARAAGYDGLVAPPTFVGHAVVEGSTLDDLRDDGLWVDRGRKVRLGVSRTMFGGEEWEFHGPVLVGDTITAQRRLGAVEEKDGPLRAVRAAALRDDVHEPARRGRRRLPPRRDRPMSSQRLLGDVHGRRRARAGDAQRVAGPAVPLQRGDPQPAPHPLRPRLRRSSRATPTSSCTARCRAPGSASTSPTGPGRAGGC